MIRVVDYLKVDSTSSTLNEEHLTIIRDRYRQQFSSETGIPEDPNDAAITEVARQLDLRLDTEDSRDYLRDCVRSENINDAKLLVLGRLCGEVQALDESIWSIPSPPETLASPPETLASPPPVSSRVIDDVTTLTDVNSTWTIKMEVPEVHDFIRFFLMQKVEALRPNIADMTPFDIQYNKQFDLPDQCLLDLFIRQQLHDRDVISSIGHQNSTRLRLVERVSLTDDFSTWQYDHWRGLFDLELTPHGDNARFPTRWRLADNARIHCRMDAEDSTAMGSSLTSSDRSRTASLDIFVQDVCSREGNGQEKAWLVALAKEDIRTFEHLANLRQSEWDNIRQLSTNAKKILKGAVDRERESADGNRRQRKQRNPDDGNAVVNTKTERCYSRSELLANLHLIKLFFWHTLREEPAVCHHGALPRLEAACLEASFDEMRREGFGDDGLFPKMSEFFLPLTISEHELRVERGSDSSVRSEQRDRLRDEITKQTDELNFHIGIYWTCDEEITSLERNFQRLLDEYKCVRIAITSNTNVGDKQRARALQQHDRSWETEQTELLQNINTKRQVIVNIEKRIFHFNEQLVDLKARFDNIEIELTKPHKHVDKNLVKPARGLILYGPPGTGKSEIMTKLAAKIGIAMVGPPLAAGELNRPLVGESERVLIALCTRCHRIPYAMCCLSIDEIDSLAPKRDEDSSEGKVDKISVLLSLIEGIKDVPNLMILCATNRLHMMDEAFLRRMSGKFFVGRPSSDARTAILQCIPDWTLEPEMLDRLAIATTNFSGAAVRAFTRAITVKCMAAQRSQRDYKINYTEALEVADRTAQQYQILIGSETLPRLLLRNLLDPSRSPIHQLSKSINYAGRIIVDLYSGHVRIEVRVPHGSEGQYRMSIVEYKLNPQEINVQALLERLTLYGKNRNVQLLQLIDLNLLAAQGAYDEKKVFETLKDRYDECVAYSRSMIVYDLDALVGVNKSESDSNMGRSTSLSVVNQNIYTYVRARFRDCAIEKGHRDDHDNIERWAVAVIREPFLLRQFCSDVQFTRTREEEEEDELERRKAKELLKCVKCKDMYIENENKMGNCVHHDGFVYDNTEADLKIYSPSEAIFLLNKLECDAVNQPDRRDEFERQKTKLKWICCDAVVVAGNAGGCKKGKHGFCADEDGEQSQQRLPDGKAHRLDQATIEQWENMCRNNEEYNDKWLLLLEKRG